MELLALKEKEEGDKGKVSTFHTNMRVQLSTVNLSSLKKR